MFGFQGPRGLKGVTDILFSVLSSFLGQRPLKLLHQRDILWAVKGSLTCGIVAFAKGLILGPPHCQRNNCCFYIPVKSQLSLVWKFKNAQPNFTHCFEFFEGFQDMAISVNCNSKCFDMYALHPGTSFPMTLLWLHTLPCTGVIYLPNDVGFPEHWGHAYT